ncbi:MAG: prenyltransferase/squalene oxidase repeat-containing protein [Pirellulales bacterium]
MSSEPPGLSETATLPPSRPPARQAQRPAEAPRGPASAQSPSRARRIFNRVRRPVISCLASLVLHAVLILVLGILLLTPVGHSAPSVLLISPGERTDQRLLELAAASSESDSAEPLSAAIAGGGISGSGLAPAYHPPSAEQPAVTERLGVEPAGNLRQWLTPFDADVTGALSLRGKEARAQLAAAGGGPTPETEDAVARGLAWLAAHQRSDGSWHFDHNQGGCSGLCRHPGSEASTTAATGIVLMAFLGNAQTHVEEGRYQEVVRGGLNYLAERMLMTDDGGDLREGTMYGQGLAAIALCEAYGMTRDPQLEKYAQRAIDYIVYAQDKNQGGWRYFPGEPGDTTVTGWQLMALKSGQMAYLRVPPRSIHDVTRFLDFVQDDKGARYGYLFPGKEPTTTSIGLLCRMYTGWQQENPALRSGVQFLSRQGPSKDNMYYNYYATQVMHHWGGEPWKLWDSAMRDYLVATQATQGHESGSWFFEGGRGAKGGRLYNTAAAIMTLEVYYRHMPLYGRQAIQ